MALVFVENIIIEAAAAMEEEAELYLGTEAMISKKLMDMASEDRYPLIAVVTGFNQVTDITGWLSVTINRIVVATKTVTTDTPIKRLTNTFISILQPVAEDFLHKLCTRPGVATREYNTIQKSQRNIFGEIPATDKIKDVLDAIEFTNVQLRIQPQVCG